MKKAILKYPLTLTAGVQEIAMPQGSTILTLQFQGDVPTIWALVELEDEQGDPNYLMPRHIQVFGTGSQVPDRSLYIATTQTGSFVWHWFERFGRL